MKTWFTSDTHFGHANIIKYCNRPFETVDAMDRSLIELWNATIALKDEVWHLGDFAFRGLPADTYLQALNGRKHLIWGNHDDERSRQCDGWMTSRPYWELRLNKSMPPIVLFHYGMRVWNRSFHGALHLFGHSHGTLPGTRKSVDVGVDYPPWQYRPVSIEQIMEHLSTLPEIS